LYLKSAFAPLAGSDGTVRAVLGVEANIDYFDSLTELKQNLYYASGLSLLGGLFLGAFFLWGQRRINDSEQRMFLTETHAHLGRMVAVVAHELRNPLMIIRGSAERLVKKTDLTEANYVIEEVDRLNEIVSGYLDFAGAGGSLLAADMPVELDLNNLVAATSKHLIEKYPNTQITWLTATPAATVKIIGYERSLRQVLLNLLFNSVESCDDSGRPVEVGVEIQDEGSTVQLTVIDHGPGLTKAEQKKIFTPFYTTRKAGSGLGLYLCRTIIDQMGGSLVLESEPDVGTEIIIRLPKEPKR
jgi:signal transduction histidine kinase